MKPLLPPTYCFYRILLYLLAIFSTIGLTDSYGVSVIKQGCAAGDHLLTNWIVTELSSKIWYETTDPPFG